MGLKDKINFRKKSEREGKSGDQVRSWRERIKDRYLLTIRNDDSLEVISNFKLTLLNLYITLSTIFVVVAILVTMILALTPLKRYVPGINQSVSSSDVSKLNKKITKLEDALTEQYTYTQALKRQLLGEYQYAEDTHDSIRVFTEEQLNVPKSEAEKQLQQDLAKGLFTNTQNTPQYQDAHSLEQFNFVSPVIGEISAGFNPNAQHYGIDVLAPKGTPIKAIADGIVLFSDWTMETGNTIVVSHSNDLVSVYKHNDQLLKKSGHTIQSGEAIAIIGNTGTLTSGPHLHFELWYRQRPVNPSNYIRFK